MLAILKKLPFYSHNWFQYLLFVVKRFIQDRCSEQASALTYTTLFAIVPMLTVFLVIISSINALAPARQQLQTMIYSNFLPKTTIAFEQALSNFAEKSSNLTVIGVMFLFVTTVMMIMSIETAFNRIWRVKKERSGIVGFMRYWTIISLGPLLLGGAVVLSSTLASMNVLHHNFGYQLDSGFLLKSLSFGLILLGFFILYWAVPNRSVPWKSAAYAAIFASIVFESLKNLFGWAMSNFTSYELVYGAFAAVPIFLLWIYLSWNIILLGVQISYASTVFHAGNQPKRHALFVMLDVLNLLYIKQKTGDKVSEDDILERLTGRELGDAPTFLALLEEKQFIQATEQGDYVLIRNLYEVNLYEFYLQLPYHFPRYHEIQQVQGTGDVMAWQEQSKQLLSESQVYLHQQLDVSLADLFEQQAPKKIAFAG
ncbi:MAG: YihY family inner membrane protein [Acinetobacter sp.]|nr:YihY family inner membrane protein [Acinetobacter sp.]